MEVTIKGPAQLQFKVTTDPAHTVLDLKQAIFEHPSAGAIPVERQRLIYGGKVLKDHESLETYKIANSHVIHLVKSNAQTTTSNANASQSSSSPTPGSRAAIPSTFATGQAVNDPLTQLTRAQNAGALGGFNPFAGMGANTSDPNLWSNLMQSDEFLSNMAESLQSPEVIDQLIAARPDMAEMAPQMREMLQSDGFRQLASDPQALRGLLQMQAAMNGGGEMPNSTINPFAAAMAAEDSSANSNDSNSTQNQPGSISQLLGMDPALLRLMAASRRAANSRGGVPSSAFEGGGRGNAFRPYGSLPFGQSAFSTPPLDSRSPEERFQNQLAKMQEMGLHDAAKNVRALLATNGNIEAALDYIYSQP